MLMAAIMGISESVKCLDCIGKDCMGAFCEGDYCLLGTYAPRWGTIEWGEPRVVKGCISGKMLENDIRSHCESADEDGEVSYKFFFINILSIKQYLLAKYRSNYHLITTPIKIT